MSSRRVQPMHLPNGQFVRRRRQVNSVGTGSRCHIGPSIDQKACFRWTERLEHLSCQSSQFKGGQVFLPQLKKSDAFLSKQSSLHLGRHKTMMPRKVPIRDCVAQRLGIHSSSLKAIVNVCYV